MWLEDELAGEGTVSLRKYCEELRVPYTGISKVLGEPRVRGMMEEAIAEASLRGVRMGSSILARRIEDFGEEMDVKTLVMASEHLAKLKGRAFEKGEGDGGTTVAVQVNLPAPESYAREVRAKVLEESRKVLDGLA
jgi:hypothetical protein